MRQAGPMWGAASLLPPFLRRKLARLLRGAIECAELPGQARAQTHRGKLPHSTWRNGRRTTRYGNLSAMRRAQAILVIVALLAIPARSHRLGHGLRNIFKPHDVLLAARLPIRCRANPWPATAP